MGQGMPDTGPPPGGGDTPTWRQRAARRIQSGDWRLGPLTKVAQQFQAAIPVGLLRREEIGLMVLATYRRNPDYYNPAHYTVRHEEELLAALERHVAAPDGGPARLLDLYCGHGREAEVFARAGYRVTGVDALAEVVDRARAYAEEAGFDAEFVAADVDRWQPDRAEWDVVYTSLWMYSTVPDRAARVVWVSRLVEWAAPGGVVVISIKPRRPGLGAKARHAIARAMAGLTRNPRRPEIGDRFTGGLFWHDSSAEEAAAELRDARVDVLEMVDVAEEPACVFYVVRAVAGG